MVRGCQFDFCVCSSAAGTAALYYATGVAAGTQGTGGGKECRLLAVKCMGFIFGDITTLEYSGTNTNGKNPTEKHTNTECF